MDFSGLWVIAKEILERTGTFFSGRGCSAGYLKDWKDVIFCLKVLSC
jgi:hypothetical protein